MSRILSSLWLFFFLAGVGSPARAQNGSVFEWVAQFGGAGPNDFGRAVVPMPMGTSMSWAR